MGLFFTFTAFIVICGLAKVGKHRQDNILRKTELFSIFFVNIFGVHFQNSNLHYLLEFLKHVILEADRMAGAFVSSLCGLGWSSLAGAEAGAHLLRASSYFRALFNHAPRSSQSRTRQPAFSYVEVSLTLASRHVGPYGHPLALESLEREV